MKVIRVSWPAVGLDIVLPNDKVQRDNVLNNLTWLIASALNTMQRFYAVGAPRRVEMFTMAHSLMNGLWANGLLDAEQHRDMRQRFTDDAEPKRVYDLPDSPFGPGGLVTVERLKQAERRATAQRHDQLMKLTGKAPNKPPNLDENGLPAKVPFTPIVEEHHVKGEPTVYGYAMKPEMVDPDAKHLQPTPNMVFVYQCIDHSTWSGRKPDGYIAFTTELKARDYVHEQTKDRAPGKPVPEEYTTYQEMGWLMCHTDFWKKTHNSERGFQFFQNMEEKNLPCPT